MSACETCWARASFLAATLGGNTADHYRKLIAEQPQGHDDVEPEEE
jgi:hypothetical protein